MANKKRYLIIDDCTISISLVRWILNGIGISNDYIDSTTDSLKSIRLLAQHSYDIVICDYDMNHHIDGGLILDEVKRRKLLAHDAVFICMTGDSSESVITHFIELEPDGILLKPFCSIEFVLRVQAAEKRKMIIAPVLAAIDNKNYQEALRLCKKLKAEHSPYLSYINRIYGDCLLRLKRHNEALEFYEKSCKNSCNTWAEIGLGQTYQALGDLGKAEDIFKKILAKHPKQPLARQHLANCMIVNNRLPDAIAEFNIAHKINSANPHRELVLANLYTALSQHNKATAGFQRFITKVTDTSRYSHGIAMNIAISLLFSGLHIDDDQQQDDLVNQAKHKIYELSEVAKRCNADPDLEFNILPTLGILSYISGDIKNALIVAHKIHQKNKPAVDFYTEINIARLYGLCGIPDFYDDAISRAQYLCKGTDDDILMLSQIKMLEGTQKEIQQRLKKGKQLSEKALLQRKNNDANRAIKNAYKAFYCIPFHYNNCKLIIELAALSTPSPLLSAIDIHQDESILQSCHWIYESDNRPSAEEKRHNHDLFELAMSKLEAHA